LNESIKQIGGNDVFEIDQDKISELQWFEDEIHADVNTDFFYKRPVSYSKKLQAITAGDLF
jgi:ribonucleotide reductase beta subunit family protein with ferritin-like domain